MSFLLESCSLCELNQPTDYDDFCCADHDLDDFFSNDCFAYAKQLLGKTYCYTLDENPRKIVCAFTLANASIRVDDLPNARKKKIETDIPHVKTLKDYPAVLLGRLGVAQEFQSKHIGSDVLNFVKFWFVEPNNKTGCRFVIVDAYNNHSTLAFYQRNGFKTVFSTDEQEKDYRHIDREVTLNTRLMYFDLLSMVNE